MFCIFIALNLISYYLISCYKISQKKIQFFGSSNGENSLNFLKKNNCSWPFIKAIEKIGRNWKKLKKVHGVLGGGGRNCVFFNF